MTSADPVNRPAIERGGVRSGAVRVHRPLVHALADDPGQERDEHRQRRGLRPGTDEIVGRRVPGAHQAEQQVTALRLPLAAHREHRLELVDGGAVGIVRDWLEHRHTAIASSAR